MALCIHIPVSAEKIDLDKWNTDSTLYTIINDGSHSNSAVVMAFLRVRYDRPSNRILMLFCLELDSYTETNKSGVRMQINGGEDIILHADSTAEYNEDKYFAQLRSTADKLTKTVFLEVTLGIKDGLPENVQLDFNLYDTEGIASNLYSLDITENSDIHPDNQADGTTSLTTKRTATTKRTKTTKSKSKTTTRSAQDKTTAESESSAVSLRQENPDEAVVNITENERVAAITVALACVFLAALGGGYIIRRKNGPNDGG